MPGNYRLSPQHRGAVAGVPPSASMRLRRGAADFPFDRRDGCRSAEEEALSVPAAQRSERVELLERLDPLGDHLDVECGAERDDGAEHLATARVAALHRQRPVELDLGPRDARET